MAGYISKPPHNAVANPAHRLSRGLVGAWTYSCRYGSVMRDRSGRSNSGTLTGSTLPAYCGSPYGSALQFSSAQSQYVSIGDKNEFSFGNGSTDIPCSFVSVFKWTSGNSGLFHKRGAGGLEYMSYVLSSGVIGANFYKDSGNYIGRTYNVALTAGRWYVAVITYDGSKASSGVNIYINSLRVDNANSQAGTYTGMSNGTAPLILGADSTTGFYWNGDRTLDMIYNRVLSQKEISMLTFDPFTMFRPKRYPVGYGKKSSAGGGGDLSGSYRNGRGAYRGGRGAYR